MKPACAGALLVVVLVAVLGPAGCASLTNFYRARDRVKVVADVVYAKGSDDPQHRLDLYLPRGAAPFPVVVFVHGGWWDSQAKDYYQPVVGLYGNEGIALAEQGVGVVNVGYRLFPAVGLDGMLDDVISALEWTQQHIGGHGGDPDRIVLMGHSAGGHLVALLGTDGSWFARRAVDPRGVRGFAPISGIYDVHDVEVNGEAAKVAEVLLPLFGADRESQDRASPLTYVGPGLPPFLFVVGENDLVTCQHSYAAMQAKVAGLDVDATFVTIPGNDHADMVLEAGGANDLVTAHVVAFVRRVTAAGGP